MVVGELVCLPLLQVDDIIRPRGDNVEFPLLDPLTQLRDHVACFLILDGYQIVARRPPYL